MPKDQSGGLALPLTPVGYCLLVKMPPAEQTTDGGIIVPEDVSDREGTASITAQVVAVGPQAYQDSDRFPTGPWCKVGDWIVMRSYQGTRIEERRTGDEYRLIHDDSVEAVVRNPSEIRRAT